MTNSNSNDSAAGSIPDFAAWMERIAQGAQALATAEDVTVGCSAKREIYREDKLVLYRYEPLAEMSPRVRTPLLICYALVNRPYMMDLQPDRSLIRGLLARGIDVYLIDWGYPDAADRFLEVKDYVLRYLPNCAEAVCAHAGTATLNLLGVCQGGTLSMCYAATAPERVSNLVTMVAPVDFHTPENLLTKWSMGVDIDALVNAVGNVPGDMLNAVFLALMPYRLLGQKYVAMFDQPAERAAVENFLRMEKWIFDSPDQPGEMFRQFLNWFVKENRLAQGTLELGGQPIRLGNIKIPVLNIYASRDHLVPPSSSRPLKNLVNSRDFSEYEFQGGHIGIYVSSAAQRDIAPRIAGWLAERDTSAGRPRRSP